MSFIKCHPLNVILPSLFESNTSENINQQRFLNATSSTFNKYTLSAFNQHNKKTMNSDRKNQKAKIRVVVEDHANTIYSERQSDVLDQKGVQSESFFKQSEPQHNTLESHASNPNKIVPFEVLLTEKQWQIIQHCLPKKYSLRPKRIERKFIKKRPSARLLDDLKTSPLIKPKSKHKLKKQDLDFQEETLDKIDRLQIQKLPRISRIRSNKSMKESESQLIEKEEILVKSEKEIKEKEHIDKQAKEKVQEDVVKQLDQHKKQINKEEQITNQQNKQSKQINSSNQKQKIHEIISSSDQIVKIKQNQSQPSSVDYREQFIKMLNANKNPESQSNKIVKKAKNKKQKNKKIQIKSSINKKYKKNQKSVQKMNISSNKEDISKQTNKQIKKEAGKEIDKQIKELSRLSVTDLIDQMQILQNLAVHKCALPFKQPVNQKRDFAPGYYKKIKQPMDFLTISEKIKNKIYHEKQEFYHDVQKIWQNSKIYNADNLVMIKYTTDIEKYYFLLIEQNKTKKQKAIAKYNQKIKNKTEKERQNN